MKGARAAIAVLNGPTRPVPVSVPAAIANQAVVACKNDENYRRLPAVVRVAGIDAITFDPPVWAMFERKKFWEAHRVMLEREYYHLENMTNLDQLPPHGFKLCVFPVKWVNTTASPVRAVAIIEN